MLLQNDEGVMYMYATSKNTVDSKKVTVYCNLLVVHSVMSNTKAVQ